MKLDLVAEGFLVKDNKVLLILHKKSGRWLGPGGHIDKNETPDDALRREFMEEVGLEIEILSAADDILLGGGIRRQLAVPFHVNVHNAGDHEHCCFYYLCRVKAGTAKLNKSESNDFGWFNQEELSRNSKLAGISGIASKALELSEKLGK